MNEIRRQQLLALDILGGQVSELQAILDELSQLTNPFDIEAKVYFFKSLAHRSEKTAERLHIGMHKENSADPTHECIHNENKQANVFGFIFKKQF